MDSGWGLQRQLRISCSLDYFSIRISSAFGLFNKFVTVRPTLRYTLSPPVRELRGGTSEYTAGGVKRVPQLPF